MENENKRIISGLIFYSQADFTVFFKNRVGMNLKYTCKNNFKYSKKHLHAAEKSAN